MKNSTAQLLEDAEARWAELWPTIETGIDCLLDGKQDLIEHLKSDDEALAALVDESLRYSSLLTDLVSVVMDDGPEYALNLLILGASDPDPNAVVKHVMRHVYGQHCAWAHAVECLAVIAEAAQVGPKVPYNKAGLFDSDAWLERLDEDFDAAWPSDLVDQVCHKLFETQPA